MMSKAPRNVFIVRTPHWLGCLVGRTVGKWHGRPGNATRPQREDRESGARVTLHGPRQWNERQRSMDVARQDEIEYWRLTGSDWVGCASHPDANCGHLKIS